MGTADRKNDPVVIAKHECRIVFVSDEIPAGFFLNIEDWSKKAGCLIIQLMLLWKPEERVLTQFVK